MKSLRLVFENDNGEREDITLPMESWISDWWFECDVVPRNDAIVCIAELDGINILGDIEATDERYVQFEEVAWHFNWDSLYDDFVSFIDGNKFFGNSSACLKKWLQENVVQ